MIMIISQKIGQMKEVRKLKKPGKFRGKIQLLKKSIEVIRTGAQDELRGGNLSGAL